MMSTPDLDFDFGFTTAEEDQEIVVDDRAERLLAAIDPFLERLKQNPKVQTIKWPDRAAEIERFRAKLQAIVDGERNGTTI